MYLTIALSSAARRYVCCAGSFTPVPGSIHVPLLLFGPQEEVTRLHLCINRSGEASLLRAYLVIPATVCGELEAGMVGVIALDHVGAAHLRFVNDALGDAPSKVPCVPCRMTSHVYVGQRIVLLHEGGASLYLQASEALDAELHSVIAWQKEVSPKGEATASIDLGRLLRSAASMYKPALMLKNMFGEWLPPHPLSFMLLTSARLDAICH